MNVPTYVRTYTRMHTHTHARIRKYKNEFVMSHYFSSFIPFHNFKLCLLCCMLTFLNYLVDSLNNSVDKRICNNNDNKTTIIRKRSIHVGHVGQLSRIHHLHCSSFFSTLFCLCRQKICISFDLLLLHC